MSSRSNGVTNVELRRRMMSWVIRSPSCSALRISRFRPSAPSGQVLIISWSRPAARTALRPDSERRSKKTRSLGAKLRLTTDRNIAASRAQSRPRTGGNAANGGLIRRRAAVALGDDAGEALGSVAIPERRRLRRRRRRLGDELRHVDDPLRLEPEQVVGAVLDRDRPLGVRAEREAGNAQVGRLLLDPAGVREDGTGVRFQREEVEVADRVDQPQARRQAGGSLAERRPRPRMDREEDRHRLRHRRQCRDRGVEQRPVDERRAVQRHQQVGPRLEAVPVAGAALAEPVLRARPASRSSCCRRGGRGRRRSPRRRGCRPPRANA